MGQEHQVVNPMRALQAIGKIASIEGRGLLTQPAAKALAVPTILVLNMDVHQNWQATKVANENPMNNLETMKPAAEVDRPRQ